MDTRRLCSPPKTINLSALRDYLFAVLKNKNKKSIGRETQWGKILHNLTLNGLWPSIQYVAECHGPFSLMPFWAPTVSKAGTTHLYHTGSCTRAHTLPLRSAAVPHGKGQTCLFLQPATLMRFTHRNKREGQDTCQSPRNEMIWNNQAKNWHLTPGADLQLKFIARCLLLIGCFPKVRTVLSGGS